MLISSYQRILVLKQSCRSMTELLDILSGQNHLLLLHGYSHIKEISAVVRLSPVKYLDFFSCSSMTLSALLPPACLDSYSARRSLVFNER